jgi:8-amino-7-oxononanoate synthase
MGWRGRTHSPDAAPARGISFISTAFKQLIMTGRPWDQVAAEDLARLGNAHLLRERRIIEPIDATHVRWDGREYINFSSNNYLGLTHHPRLIAATTLAAEKYGTGAGAAPLISGYGPAHAAAERAIARWKGTQAAVILPSGYQANHAAIQTAAAIGRLGGNGVRFLVDKLAHASLIDAVRGTGEALRVFPHNHVAKLQRLLEDAPQGQLQVVVTESIFSMDGDAADLPAIAELKQRHNFLLLLDEAHAAGVYGPHGNGLAAEMGVADAVDVTVMTLSKALGGIGGGVCASSVFCDALINYGRAYLFSTSVPPMVAAGAEEAVAIVQDEPARRDRLRAISRHVRERIGRTKFVVPAGDSPIIPIVLGEERAALDAAERLWSEGLLVMAVRPPTVPRGSSRLRVTLCSEHTDAEVERLLDSVEKLL